MSQWGQQPGYQYPMQTGFPGQGGFQQNPQQQQFQGQNPQFGGQQGGFGAGGSGMGGGFGGGLAPQPTGFPGRPQGFQQPQPTGFQQPQQTGFPGGGGPGGSGFMQAQPTGFPGASNFGQQNRAPPPPVPPVPPIPSQFQNNQPQQPHQTGFLGANQGTNRFQGPSPGFGGGPLTAQPTGFAGRTPAPLAPQMTGFVDPRLQMMSSSFMPVNTSAPYTAGGAPQLPSVPQQLGGMSLQQSFEQHNQQRGVGNAPKVPWTLSKAEKKNYDQIFRAWDAQGTGFINGQTALEVFGQSGLDRNDLAKVWSLADGDNRGKLNLAEFHVAMGLIYRRLNGNEMPNELPPELIPPSSRDLDTSVNFLKDILKNDTRARSPSGVDSPVSRLKERSFNSPAAGAGGRQDATVYKHSDSEPPGGFYQPRSRHLDRDAVRSRNDDNPSGDLSDLKRQLASTQRMLDDSKEAEASRTAEDDGLEREMDDMRYRIKRLQEDLEYVSRGPRSTAKDEERRKLERELLALMHERLPELERRIEDRQARKEREKREWTRERDRRNDRFGRYDEREGREGAYSPARGYRDEERERPYSRGGSRYDDREREYDRDRPYRERDAPREDRDMERVRGLANNANTASRTPPPPPPPAVPSAISQPPPPPPAPAKSPAPTSNMKNMSAEERQAFIRAEAKRRLDARMQALGVAAPSSTGLDASVEDRLAQEKKEAEEKAREAERQAEERERARQERLMGERAVKEGKASPAPLSPAVPAAPAPPTPQTPTPRAAPPAPKARPPPPPARGRGGMPRTPTRPPALPVATPPAPTPPVPPAPVAQPQPRAQEEESSDSEDEVIKAREAALKKKREERAARLRRLEEEEEEARRAEEEFAARRAAARSPAPPVAPVVASPPPPPVPPIPAVSSVQSTPATEAPPAPAPPPPPPPPAPPAPAPATDKGTNNPFSKMLAGGGASAAAAAATITSPPAVPNGAPNPFFRPQTAPIPSSSPAAATATTPTPPAPKGSYNTAPSAKDDDDWDDVVEKDDGDSSDEELSRDVRSKIAGQLFGGLMPSRPQSAGPVPGGGGGGSGPASPGPMSAPPGMAPAPPAPPAPAPPAPPAAPPAPRPAVALGGGGGGGDGDRGALLSAIQAGKGLRKVVTNDRSKASLAGSVVGDAAPPEHINAAPRAPSPPVAAPPPPPPAPGMGYGYAGGEEDGAHGGAGGMGGGGHSKRESVDWYNGLAADHGQPPVPHVPDTVAEEEESSDDDDYEHVGPESVEGEAGHGGVPQIQVHEAEHVGGQGDELMADIDMAKEYRVRSLFAYEGQRAEDLSFGENIVMKAHPSKSGGDWWYGTLVKEGKSGFFPQTYVQTVETVKATALYSYAGGNADELPFAEGDTLTIVDKSETDWWKAEQDGVVFIVPAAYLELVEVGVSSVPPPPPPPPPSAPVPKPVSESAPEPGPAPTQSGRPELPRIVTPRGVINAHEGEDHVDSDEELQTAQDHSDDDDYYSMSESDSDEDSIEDTVEDREARELERQRVLEAAGFVVSKDVDMAAVRKRRPPPAAPQRSSESAAAGVNSVVGKDLPPISPRSDAGGDADYAEAPLSSPSSPPSPPPSSSSYTATTHVDDAFDRYENFRKTHVASSNNRMSVASVDSNFTAALSSASGGGAQGVQSSGTPPPRSPATSLVPTMSTSSAGGGSGVGHYREGSRDGAGESRTSQFLSFLSRHGRSATPGEERERERRTISGPISGPIPMSNQVSGQSLASEELTREESPAFGSSWASLVDKTALEEIPKHERRRQEAIFEFISTEADYVRDLQLMVELFYSRLMDPLGEKGTAVVFANIEDILLTNTTFVSSLEQRQKECRLYIDRIGDIFKAHMPNMGVYLSYCVNQTNGSRLLQSMRDSNPELAAQLQRIREEPSARNLDLSSYLLVPMQRMTRYPLLIRQVLQYTQLEEDKADISAALHTAERILSHINETIREQEGEERLREISRNLWIGQGRLDLTAPTRYMGPRRLLKEGILSKSKSGRKLRAFLCSDILVLTDDAGKQLYRIPIPLGEIQIKDAGRRDDMAFRVLLPYPRGGDTIALRASSVRDCQLWMDTIVRASKKCREAEKRASRKIGPSATYA